MFPDLLSRIWVLTIVWIAVSASSTHIYANANPQVFPVRNACGGRLSCHECIQTPECAWCSTPGFQGPRCFSPSHSTETRTSARCLETFTWNPDNVFTVLRNEKLTTISSSVVGDSSHRGSSSSSSSGDRQQEIVQLSPQEIRLTLRIRQPHNVRLSYARAEDFPVDVYYLVNFRQPVQNGTNILITLGEMLAESLSNVTSDFRLGFGSTFSNSLDAENQKTYGFKHVMRLSRETSTFAGTVRSFIASNNSETVNGGPDAILQAIVCSDQIGWRSNARKILIFATDTEFPHNIDTLGEGMQRNDALCHLTATRVSTYASSQGYPTVSQINDAVNLSRINIIWAATAEKSQEFRGLTNYVVGSSAQILNSDPSNILELIKSHYATISTSVEMKDTAGGNVEVKYFSSCLKHGAMNETSRCGSLKVGDKIEFLAKIEATKCPTDKSQWHQQFVIYPIGIAESLTVNLDLLCACDCENPTHHDYQTESPICSHGGTLKCGICECDHDRFGSRCECSSEIRDQGCRSDNTSVSDCSGRGHCICGTCTCDMRQNPDEIISGRFCECDNFSCDRHNGLLCSGHGVCECGQCLCESSWTGPACSCPTSNHTCVKPGDTTGVLCAGHGQCICGQCDCQSEPVLYYGRFCDELYSGDN